MNTNPASSIQETYTRHGITIRRRPVRSDMPAKFVTRIRFRGKVHFLTLAETATKSFEMAQAARRAIHESRWDDYKAQTAFRPGVAHSTCADLFAAYRQFAGLDRPAEPTREQNIHALESIIRDVLGPETDIPTLSLTKLTADLLWQWKEKKRQLATDAEDDERAVQLLRSANSRLRQARSLFADTEDLRKFYQNWRPTAEPGKVAQARGVILPDNLAAFMSEPPFPNCDKQEYHAPHDRIIAATFASLEQLAAPGPMPSTPALDAERLNLYKAIWLAIGFGLRRSEISQARASWFVNVAGVVYCRGDVLAKNKKFPEVRAQLGAWDKLRPHLERLAPGDYILAGTKTEREGTCFRRISEWMRSLGWETTHHTHEFRAWAGCQIAMAPGGRGLLDAQVFMRHASFATTEKFYGHHLKIRLNEVQLTLPVVTKEFTPVVLAASESAAG